MKKIVIALLLTLCMVTALIPVATSAQNDIADGTMIYFEDFSTVNSTTSTDETIAALKWKLLDATTSYKNNTANWTIQDGKLVINNYEGVEGGGDSYVKILNDEDMWEVCQGAWTLQYDINYKAASAADRYLVVVTHYMEDANATYNSFHVRARGSANNQLHFANAWQTYDVAGDFYAADTKDGDGTTTIRNKLYGTDYVESEGVLFGKNVSIRVVYPEIDGKNAGPDCYMKDLDKADSKWVKVSEASSDAAGSGYYDLELLTNYGVAIKCGGKIDGTIDNIMIWTGNGEQPTDTTVTYKAPEMPESTEAQTTEKPVVTTKEPEKDTEPEATTNAPEGTTAAPKTDDTTAAPKTDDKKSGCKSVMGLVAVMALVPAAVLVKRKKH